MAARAELEYTYAHAYLEAFRLPVNKGESSARNRISVFTLSASPAKKMVGWLVEKHGNNAQKCKVYINNNSIKIDVKVVCVCVCFCGDDETGMF